MEGGDLWPITSAEDERRRCTALISTIIPPKSKTMTVLRPRVPKAKTLAKATSNTGVVAFALLVGGAFFSIPFVAHFMKSENLTSQEKPLNATQIRRGPYQNTGSRDVGVDTDWDFATNTWNGRKGADVLRDKARRQSQEQQQRQQQTQAGRDDA